MRGEPSFAIGTLIQNRYFVASVLGQGGFSTVYLVRDLSAASRLVEPGTTLYAIKELRSQDPRERLRFAFEGEVLKRLKHWALPRVYAVSEDTRQSRTFMLMEYIEGLNLESLRRQQPDKRFPLPLMLTLMEPIVDAVAYLHRQQPPILHRDVKPANVIVTRTGERAVLVDFGIAKEYHAEETTTATRHVSPGYGAPEQYSGQGTDPRTDIYGLGAMCYVLLTGIVPPDALQRLRQLASKGSDPLLLANEVVPAIPQSVAQAIQRTTSIDGDARFPTVEEFWQTLRLGIQGASSNSFPLSSSPFSQLLMNARSDQGEGATFHLPARQEHALTRKSGLLFLRLFAIILLIGFALGIWAYTNNHQSGGLEPSLAKSPAVLSPLRAVKTTVASPSTRAPTLVGQYQGTIHSLLTNTNTTMSLTSVQQSDERIDGSFSGLHITGTFTGVLDTSQHIFFTVGGSTDHTPLFFEGAVRSDGNLAGNYCAINQAGQCVNDYGIWSIAPSSPAG